MKENIRRKIRGKNNVIITVIIILFAGVSIYALREIPVAINLLELPKDPKIKPFGPITIEHPYKECLPSNIAESGVFKNNISGANLELYMATYQQEIDADYSVILDNQILPDNLIDEANNNQIRCGEGCNGSYLEAGVLKGDSVQDNKYVEVLSLSQNLSDESVLCLHIRPLYKDPIHPLTIWLDSQNRPMFKIKKSFPLYEAMGYLASESPFYLGKELVFGLCLAYILSLMGFIIIICRWAYEQDKQKQESQAKSEHHKRTGNKRV